ncbi:hypothetical protein [Carboxylicivirga sp. M1479]|uniref:hypothetical protein n=1 Tax=Carboxylicivirga sp. M1479 TaxID=2594476 RepID=UPI001177F7BA|nr:hypothetical protein [Carboxylicivirga sp. M1479]TRX66040.1 hypothetical protein FNN09_15675 [Carboxylicivirga sp. M1479]
MRTGILICALLLTIFSSMAQDKELIDPIVVSSIDNNGLAMDTSRIADFHVQVGLSAFSDFDGMYGFNTYVAPQWSVMPFSRFQVDVMPFISRTNYYNIPAYGHMDATKLKFDDNMLQFGLYTQATYMLTSRLYAGASFFLNTNMPESSQSSLQGFNNYGASTFVGYRFTEYFSAEVSFGISKYPSINTPTSGFSPMIHPRNPYNRF